MSKVKRRREFLKDYDNYKTFKKQRQDEYTTKNLNKIENETTEDFKIYNKEKTESESTLLIINQANFDPKFSNNNEIFEMNRIKADMNLNVDESDVDYMKVIENGKIYLKYNH